MEHSLYYIAYGSNLNIRQMEARCPSARVHHVGRIPDYELVFKALGVCAYATIKPCKGVYVAVAVWRISPQDELNLDRYEGFPSHYY
ncbi:gamma-glutamylcyclotransferase family protein [Lachnospiraceae bacterium 48-33]